MKPYTGKVLWVDLTTGSFSEEVIPDSVYQQVLAGAGLGAWLLYREIPAGADPLGPENVLGFLPGLLTGTGSLFSGRWMAVAKSPLTGAWGEANCGGNLAYAIKQCGYDGILFKGRSEEPVYLYIDHHGPELRDAAHQWGKDAVETEDALLAETQGKKKPAVAAIGPAGENLSRISGIVNDRGRLAARGGLGAVMGSKKLKAVVLVGSKRVGAHDPVKMKLLSWQCSRNVMLPAKNLYSRFLSLAGQVVGKIPLGMTQSGTLFARILAHWGTIGTYPACVGMGDTPFKNWAGTAKDLPGVYESIEPDRLLEREKRKYHCRGCPVGCGGIIELKQDQASGEPKGVEIRESHKPEYETTAGFTALLLNDDLDLVCEINELLNRAGMDTISAAGTIAFAMECFEKGWITREDTGGLDLTWGNRPAVLEVLRQMIARQGFGAWLSDGVKQAAESLPPEAQDAAIHAGGQEIAFHDTRPDPGMALLSSVDPTPGRHTSGGQTYYEMYRLWTRIPRLPSAPSFYARSIRFTPTPDVIDSLVAVSEFTQFFNCVGACYMGMMIGVDRVPIFEWTEAATGWNLEPEDYLRSGRRIQTLRQMFNLRQGIDPRRVNISPRLTGSPPLKTGPNKGLQFDLEAFKGAYWEAIGWDRETGIPLEETLRDLDLLQIANPSLQEVQA